MTQYSCCRAGVLVHTSYIAWLDRLQRASHPVPAAVNGTLAHCSRAQRIAHCVSEKRGTSLPSRRSARGPRPPIPTVTPVLPFSLSGASRADGAPPPPPLARTEIRRGRTTPTASRADGEAAARAGGARGLLHPQRWIFHCSGTICSRCSSTRPSRSHLPLVWLHL